MTRCIRPFAVALAAALSLAPAAALAEGYQTTYGEDPVPPTKYYHENEPVDYLYPGYGADPIPAKSLTQRWAEWRVRRGLSPYTGPLHRLYSPQAPKTSDGWPAIVPHDERPSSRRGYQPSGSGAR
jgi:hypothetical protein